MQTRPAEPERLFWIDLLRAMAIICVVLVHAIDLVSWKSVPTTTVEFLSASLLSFVGACGVPVFLFITGALLLADPHAIEPEKIRMRLYRLGAAYALYIVLGLAINLGLDPGGLNMSWSSLGEMSSIGYINAGWYLRFLILFYIFLPLFHGSIRSLETRRIALPIGISILGYALMWDLDKLHPVWLDLQFEPMFIYFVLYPILGYLIHDRKLLAGVRTVWLIVAIVGPLALHVTSSVMLAGSRKIPWALWYNSAGLFICTAAIFEWVRRAAQGARPGRFVHASAALGRLAFSIYILHLFFMYPLLPWIRSFGFIEWIFLATAVSLGASIVTSMVLVRLPGLRRILR